MKHTRSALAVLVLLMGATTPALAGQPDNPGAKGEMVNADKAYWQDETGDKNAWGQTVSGVAKGENENETLSLGRYLQFMAGGPNPFVDNGGGNN